MKKHAIYSSVVVLLVLCLAFACSGQEAGSTSESNIELGASVGMLIFSGTDIPSFTTFGINGGGYVRPGVEIGLAYSRAGISFLGIELMSINLFDGFVGVDLSPANRFGVLLRLGGSYLQANALGEGVGGMTALAGLGLRISPIDMMDIFAQYTARFRSGLLSTIEAGIKFRF